MEFFLALQILRGISVNIGLLLFCTLLSPHMCMRNEGFSNLSLCPFIHVYVCQIIN